MITSIELGDFLSHARTNLDFDNGVTVFVGHNGAGNQVSSMQLPLHYLDSIQENQTTVSSSVVVIKGFPK